VPSLYFSQGIPYVVVMTLSVILYKRLELSNTDIALYTSWLYLPWVIKPLWAPLLELYGHKRRWIVGLQFMVGAVLASVAVLLPLPGFFQATLAAFWLMAFASATHDIAADGFYLYALTQRRQAAFVGVRSTFFRLSMIAGQGGLVYLAGQLEERTGQVVYAWSVVFLLLGAAFAGLALYHAAVLPRPAADRPPPRQPGSLFEALRSFGAVFAAFFRRPDILTVLAFLLLFRFSEAQLLKLATPFLLDGAAAGGLGLSTSQVGVVYGVVGVGCLTVGGLLGGWVIARHGLRAWLLPMALAMNLPNAAYLALAAWQPAGTAWVTAAVAVEQLGYGFGFAAYLMFMIWVAGRQPGKTADEGSIEGNPEGNPMRTAHYALCTGFMALGMMLPGMWSGWLQAQLGYAGFFGWVLLAALPSLLMAVWVKLPPSFGREDR
jgi:PAT family beta-lactamase induction signal transducer AmpG